MVPFSHRALPPSRLHLGEAVGAAVHAPDSDAALLAQVAIWCITKFSILLVPVRRIDRLVKSPIDPLPVPEHHNYDGVLNTLERSLS